MRRSGAGCAVVHKGRIAGNGERVPGGTEGGKSVADAALGASQGGGAAIAQNWLNLRAERALSNFDQRHLLNLQAQYTTGSGVFHAALLSGWHGLILKEWTFAGQLMLGSGTPLTPVYPIAMPGTGIVGIIRPSRTAAPIDEAPPGLFLNPAAHVPPPAAAWGNAGRNSITGPDQFCLDVSLGRTFRLRDMFTFDLRLDGSNILNHVTFPSWDTTINLSKTGLSVSDRLYSLNSLEFMVRSLLQ